MTPATASIGELREPAALVLLTSAAPVPLIEAPEPPVVCDAPVDLVREPVEVEVLVAVEVPLDVVVVVSVVDLAVEVDVVDFEEVANVVDELEELPVTLNCSDWARIPVLCPSLAKRLI